MTAFKSGDPLTLNRLYGRSSGHKLRKGQQELVERLLPQIEVPEDGEITSRRLFGEDRPRARASSMSLVSGTIWSGIERRSITGCRR